MKSPNRQHVLQLFGSFGENRWLGSAHEGTELGQLTRNSGFDFSVMVDSPLLKQPSSKLNFDADK